MATDYEYRAKELQDDPKKMVKIWENSLRAGYEKIDREPSQEKRKQMIDQMKYGKARLEHYKKLAK